MKSDAPSSWPRTSRHRRGCCGSAAGRTCSSPPITPAGKIPRQLGRLGVSVSELTRHIAWDIGIRGDEPNVCRRRSTPLPVFQTYSRLVISTATAPLACPVRSRRSSEYAVPGNVGLTQTAKDARVAEIFTPYHDRITSLLDARAAAGRRTVYIAMHSFTPTFKGESRAMQIGVLYIATHAWPTFCSICCVPKAI